MAGMIGRSRNYCFSRASRKVPLAATKKLFTILSALWRIKVRPVGYRRDETGVEETAWNFTARRWSPLPFTANTAMRLRDSFLFSATFVFSLVSLSLPFLPDKRRKETCNEDCKSLTHRKESRKRVVPFAFFPFPVRLWLSLWSIFRTIYHRQRMSTSAAIKCHFSCFLNPSQETIFIKARSAEYARSFLIEF